MPFTVYVENFQSLSNVTVTVDGFTVVTGTNNVGKSALLRAIRGAFQNARGTSYIRHGQTKATVEITFDDGKKLRWEKGKAAGDKPTYIINGGSPIHPGQGVPDEVRALGIKPIIISGREVWPQFAPQFTGQIFLLDQPGSVLAEAVSDVNHVSQLNEALRLAESDKRSAAAELKVRLVDQVTLQSVVRKYDGLDELDAEVQALEVAHAKTVKIGSAIQVAMALKGRLKEAQSVVDKLAVVEEVEIPDSKDACATLHTLDDMIDVRDRAALIKTVVEGLTGVQEMEIPDTNDAVDTLNDLEALTHIQGRMNTAKDAVNKLMNIHDLDDVDCTETLKLWDVLQAASGLRDKLVDVQTAAASFEEQALQANDTFNAVMQEIEVVLGDLGECPTCGTIHIGGHLS